MTIKSKRSVLPSHRFGVVAIVIIFAVSLVAATAEQARADVVTDCSANVDHIATEGAEDDSCFDALQDRLSQDIIDWI